MRIRGAALGVVLGVVALLPAGCEVKPKQRGRHAVGGGGTAGVHVEQGPVDTLPGRLGGGVAAATQQGVYPLGPSVTQVGPRMPTGTGGISLNGTVPSRLVRSGAQPVEVPVQVRPRMGGDIAYIPSAPDHYGGGMTARNGQGGRSWGSAYVPSTDFTDPATIAGAGGVEQPGSGGGRD